MQPQNFSSCVLPSPLAARLDFSVLCSTMTPLRFHCTGVCWGWIKYFRENHIDCQSFQLFGYIHGYRKGLLPLQTVETDANGDSRSTYDMCPSLAGFFGLIMRVQKSFVLHRLLFQYNHLFPNRALFHFICPGRTYISSTTRLLGIRFSCNE